MSEFGQFQFGRIVPRHLFNSEIERLIIEYCKENDLILPQDFSRRHYVFYSRQEPWFMGVEYSILFQARLKTEDDVLREQIEFQIKQMEQ
ncbi:hypothetical protein ACSV4D_09355 [Flavobacterium sp. ARAG 55.4]